VPFEPRKFYRKLDHLLHEISEAPPDREWFGHIALELVERFGEELQIENGRVYTETPAGFELEQDIGSRDPSVKGLVIRWDYKPLQLLLHHSVYLFDASVDGFSQKLESRLGGEESAGVLVEGHPRRILGFGLRPGWDRARLDFALNTIRNAINQRMRVEHLQTDMAQAAEIQMSLLPRESPPLPGYTIAAQSIPATQVGGDFYDFQEGSDSVYLAVGDVSGHGVSSALLARDVVTGLRMGSDREFKITSIVERLNRVIARSILSTRFVSLFFGELERNGNLFYVNAGHIAPWIFGRRGTRRLTVGGMILGPVADTPFKRGFAHVDKGDTLVMVTDGIVEREAPDGTMFDDAGLEAAVGPVVGREAEEVLQAVFSTALGFGADRPWADDTTALVATREAPTAA